MSASFESRGGNMNSKIIFTFFMAAFALVSAAAISESAFAATVNCNECQSDISPVKCDACREQDKLTPTKCTACRDPEEAVSAFQCKNCSQTIGTPCDSCRPQDNLNPSKCTGCYGSQMQNSQAGSNSNSNSSANSANQFSANSGGSDSGIAIVYGNIQAQDAAQNTTATNTTRRGFFGNLFNRIFRKG